MKHSRKLDIFNDPIYGFISIPDNLVYQLISHPLFQRLRRISQMGFSFLVYPGAHHTRFHHALGAMHLMQLAISVLRKKGIQISDKEEKGLLCAILLHDIGHGPFSHALEHEFVKNVSHEEISLQLMNRLNADFDGALHTAISIFTGQYPRKFMNQLVSSQLDMDRLDYLKRDSFYTGVAEGNINAERLIIMLNVYKDELVVEEKGIYSVEKFLMARRFMYWQVYLHKTGLVAEQLLIRVIRRARHLVMSGRLVLQSEALNYFLKQELDRKTFTGVALEKFSKLDDVDILSALKNWQDHEDRILSELSSRILNRQLLTIKLKKKPVSENKKNHIRNQVKTELNLDENTLDYLVFEGEISNRAYNRKHQAINLIRENGKITDVAKVSDHLNLEVLSDEVRKYYICYPKNAV